MHKWVWSANFATVVVALVVLILGLVAIIRCPAGEIPQLIGAFGAWLHISIQV